MKYIIYNQIYEEKAKENHSRAVAESNINRENPYHQKSDNMELGGEEMSELKFYTLTEVAEKLQVTRRTLYNYIKDGKLKANKVVSKWIVTEEQLKDFIEGKTDNRD